MSDGKETLLGSTKYDGKIRRITLIKTVADKLNMHDGDEIEYYYNGTDVIIRKGRTSEINLPALFRSLSTSQVCKTMEFFCSTNETSNCGKDVNWSKLPKNKVEEEFMRTIDSMTSNERICLANKLLHELVEGKRCNTKT
jgi:hypothetical protein